MLPLPLNLTSFFVFVLLSNVASFFVPSVPALSSSSTLLKSTFFPLYSISNTWINFDGSFSSSTVKGSVTCPFHVFPVAASSNSVSSSESPCCFPSSGMSATNPLLELGSGVATLTLIITSSGVTPSSHVFLRASLANTLPTSLALLNTSVPSAAIPPPRRLTFPVISTPPGLPALVTFTIFLRVKSSSGNEYSAPVFSSYHFPLVVPVTIMEPPALVSL